MPRAAVLATVAAALVAGGRVIAAPGADADADVAIGGMLTMEVVGACPDVDTVRRLLAGLVSAEQARAAPVSVQDRGPSFRVAVRDEATMLADPARDCAARARQAAAVAAVALQAPR